MVGGQRLQLTLLILNLSFTMSVMSYLVKEGISGEGYVTAFQSIFPRDLIDERRDLWKMSSSNPEELFPFVFIASLSSDFVRDLVDLNVSLIAIAYCDAQ